MISLAFCVVGIVICASLALLDNRCRQRWMRITVKIAFILTVLVLLIFVGIFASVIVRGG